MVCENFADPFNIEAILDNVTDNDSFFYIYIVETPIDYSNGAEGDIDPLQLEVNDNNDADDNDDDEDDHDRLIDNANAAEGDIDPLQLEVNDNNGADDNDDNEDDHDGLLDNANDEDEDANENNYDNDSDCVSVSSDISLASTVQLDEAFLDIF